MSHAHGVTFGKQPAGGVAGKLSTKLYLARFDKSSALPNLAEATRLQLYYKHYGKGIVKLGDIYVLACYPGHFEGGIAGSGPGLPIGNFGIAPGAQQWCTVRLSPAAVINRLVLE